MENKNNQILKDALDGDINAFQNLFTGFQNQLKSYLYRLLANRNDAEDLTHDTFIKAFDKLSTFKGEASLKTWVFQIATNLAYNYLQRQKRWTPDVSEQAKKLVIENPTLRNEIIKIHETSPDAKYDMKEHIDTCFTCISKNLPIENQIVLMLKDIYDFSIAEICLIIEKTEGVVKYLLQDSRKIMTDIFDNRCALVNKNGVCHQCSELNGWFNPKENQQQALIKLDLAKGSKKYNRKELYHIRTALVKAIDPLRSKGSDLQEILLKCNSMAMGETPIPN
ncbi:MAG TPA: sigma-70 family RNA polymerase sigma factor [Saprospiraceae bacterium]|nr:sigma-70 family RNA polymerase sigma factor [Saprospiraceae bacterium]HMP26252.1 sigma-70 family RNA polymerase sigma factor [Saprospiraceae bacterium]